MYHSGTGLYFSLYLRLIFLADIHVFVRKRLRVLVPGAGLGRLAYDVASLGTFSRSLHI